MVNFFNDLLYNFFQNDNYYGILNTKFSNTTLITTIAATIPQPPPLDGLGTFTMAVVLSYEEEGGQKMSSHCLRASHVGCNISESGSSGEMIIDSKQILGLIR